MAVKFKSRNIDFIQVTFENADSKCTESLHKIIEMYFFILLWVDVYCVN